MDWDPNIVEVCVGYLRRKLDKPGSPSLITTVRGAGYSLRAKRVASRFECG